MANEYERLRLRVEDGVAFVTLVNPPLNVMTLPLFGELARLSLELAADDAVRALVLRSDDPDFWIAHFDVEAILGFPIDALAPSARSRWTTTRSTPCANASAGCRRR